MHRSVHSSRDDEDEVEARETESVLDARVNELLWQRQQLAARVGGTGDGLGGLSHLSCTTTPDTRICRVPQAAREPSGFRSLTGDTELWTPERPTTAGETVVTRHHGNPPWDARPDRSGEWTLPIEARSRGSGNERSTVLRSTNASYQPAGADTPSWDDDSGGSRTQLHRQRVEQERLVRNRQTAELVAALDDARRSILRLQQEVDAARAEVVDCEDRYERLRFQHELLASCYERDRAYFTQFALASVAAAEDSGRRELVAKEAEWRSAIALADTRRRAHGRSADHSPWTARSGSAPMPPAPRPVHGAWHEEDEREPLNASFNAGPRSLSASLDVSPRAHRAMSPNHAMPPLSPKTGHPTHGTSVSEDSGAGGGGGGTTRMVNCKSSLLAEVTSSKRLLEEQLRTAEEESRRGEEAAARTEAALRAHIASLEQELAEERQLTEEMQLEMDDMIISELLSRETEGRLCLEGEAASSFAAVLLSCAHEEKRCTRACSCSRSQPPPPLTRSTAQPRAERPAAAAMSGRETLKQLLRQASGTHTAQPESVSMDFREERVTDLLWQLSSPAPPPPSRTLGSLSSTPTRDSGTHCHDTSASSTSHSHSPSSARRRAREQDGEVDAEVTPMTEDIARGQTSPVPLPREQSQCKGDIRGGSSQPASFMSQGVSPEHQGAVSSGSESGATPPLLTFAEDHASQGEGTEAEEGDAMTQLSSPVFSSSAAKRVCFDMPQFLSPALSPTTNNSATHDPAARSPPRQSSATLAESNASCGGSHFSMRVPGEELFQPQALSFSALPSHAWDVADSDDESVPALSPRGTATMGSPDVGLSRCHRRTKITNPYDMDDDDGS